MQWYEKQDLFHFKVMPFAALILFYKENKVSTAYY